MKTIEIPKGFDTTVDQQKIDQLKKLFFEEYEKNPDLYDERDVNHLRNSDLHAVRFFIMAEHDLKSGFEALKTGFQWRKSFGLHDITEENFPKEFFDLAGLFECGVDRFGFPCVYVRVKTIRKIKQLDHHQMQFLAYMVNKIERRHEQLQCWTLVFDCTDIGFCNVNLTLIHFLIDLLRNYFPLSVRYAIVLNVPWILNAIQKFVLSLLPEDNRQLIRFVNNKGLRNFKTNANIPSLIGGSFTKDIFECSPKCMTVEVFAKTLYNLDKEEVEKIMKPYEALLNETLQLKDELIKSNKLVQSKKLVDNKKVIENNKLIENPNNTNNNNNYEIIQSEECIEVAN